MYVDVVHGGARQSLTKEDPPRRCSDDDITLTSPHQQRAPTARWPNALKQTYTHTHTSVPWKVSPAHEPQGRTTKTRSIASAQRANTHHICAIVDTQHNVLQTRVELSVYKRRTLTRKCSYLAIYRCARRHGANSASLRHALTTVRSCER